jgi:hypothetical protein
VALLLEQAHQVGLLTYQALAQDAHDGGAALELLSVGQHGVGLYA